LVINASDEDRNFLGKVSNLTVNKNQKKIDETKLKIIWILSINKDEVNDKNPYNIIYIFESF